MSVWNACQWKITSTTVRNGIVKRRKIRESHRSGITLQIVHDRIVLLNSLCENLRFIRNSLILVYYFVSAS